MKSVTENPAGMVIETVRAMGSVLAVMLMSSCTAIGAGGDRQDLASAAEAISPAYDPDNLIARTVRGEMDLPMLYENELAIAFLIDRPASRGHFLVALKTSQARNLLELDDRETLALMHVTQRVAAAEMTALGAQGFTVRQNNGSASSVAQYHMHVIPRWAGDSVPSGVGAPVAIASLADDATVIRAAIAN